MVSRNRLGGPGDILTLSPEVAGPLIEKGLVVEIKSTQKPKDYKKSK